MIAPMLKYQLLVHHRELSQVLNELRKLGIAHIDTTWNDQDAAAKEDQLRNFRRLQERYQWLSNFKAADLPENPPLNTEALIIETDQIRTRLSELEKETRETRLRWKVLEPWGDIPAGRLQSLQEYGIYTYFFHCPAGSFQQDWKKEMALEIIHEDKHQVHFVVLSDRLIPPSLNASMLDLKDASLQELAIAQHQQQQEHRALRERLMTLAACIPMLLAEMLRLEEESEWENVLNGTQVLADGKLHLIHCWVPENRSELFVSFLNHSNLVWKVSRPTPDESTPVLLQNDRFSRLFHPVGELFSLPAYTELDLTPFFAPFFTLFFGMCLGDVGYGLIILLALTVLKWSRRAPALRNILTLGQFLGTSAAVFGLLTGTVFGADLSKHSAEWLVQWQTYFLSVDQLFNLSLSVGLIQILFGMALRVWNRSRLFGWLYGLSSLGWILAITGGLLSVGWNRQLSGMVLVIAGLALIIFFSDPGKGLLSRFGLGLWDLYGVTGLFGDVLSYVRLFALGLSSGILGFVVNNIAFSLLDGRSVIGILFFVIILLFGHGLNFAISTLSAFVHPIRLTFVEFYKNAGFTGGGIQYNPFMKKHFKTES